MRAFNTSTQTDVVQTHSLRTEDAYVYWVKNYIRFHGLKHPRDMGQADVLTDIAMQNIA